MNEALCAEFFDILDLQRQRLCVACHDPQVFGADADGDWATSSARNGDYRSMAPFPAMIFGRNFSMRDIRVSGFLVEPRLMT